MNMLDTVIKPMHPEGRRFVAIFAVITAALFWLWAPLGWIGLGLTIWCYYFFRDPERFPPQRPNIIISPADGIVSLIEPAVPPAELGMADEALTRVSVFMNVFNCHVNRAPVPGTVAKVAYRAGKFVILRWCRLRGWSRAGSFVLSKMARRWRRVSGSA